MSIQRAIRRRRAQKSGTPWPTRERPFKDAGKDAYATLRPTKGWLRVAAVRLRAQARLRHMAEVIAKRMAR